ncbi:hypothetical protein BBP40_010249 [Aspergillus hancockii]|nr:hypothetical protein BBP40_010249 [Aspergillus hancockii]
MQERDAGVTRTGTHDEDFGVLNSAGHSWAVEVPWLRRVTSMEIWMKGVLTAEDVELAVGYGCDGVIVSNHGGRQLDEAVAPVDALPECVRAARGRIRAHVDGGIRSGSDIFKSLALGADRCCAGRPTLWGLAKDVDLMLETVYREFKRGMQLTGCTSVFDISPAYLAVARGGDSFTKL